MAQTTAVTGEITHGHDTAYDPILDVCAKISTKRNNISPPMAALFFFLLRSSGTRHRFAVAITGLGAADLTAAINPRT